MPTLHAKGDFFQVEKPFMLFANLSKPVIISLYFITNHIFMSFRKKFGAQSEMGSLLYLWGGGVMGRALVWEDLHQ